MALIALDSYVPKTLVGIEAMMDEDGSNMQDLCDWVLQVGGFNSATCDSNMYVLTITTEKNGSPVTFNYQPGYYLILNTQMEFSQLAAPTFEALYQQGV